MGKSWFRHVKKLIFKVVYFVIVLQALRKFVNDSSEEHIDHKGVDSSFVENI